MPQPTVQVPTEPQLPTGPTPAPQGQPQGQAQPAVAASHASLYVGDLHADTAETQLYEKFGAIGTVVSIKVCRDFITRRSLRYAYVNFLNHADAEKAIDQLNFEEVRGRPMRIMWSQRDPSLRKSGAGNIFIKNLDKCIEVRELYDTFSAFGQILSCKIATDENSVSKGYGFVHYKTPEGAEKAIKGLHGMLIHGKQVHVCAFLPRHERGSDGTGRPRYNNVFIKNFGEEIDESQFGAMFEGFGEILSAKLELNEEGKPKGFGFVCFKDTTAAEKAVNDLNGTEYNGRTLFVGPAQKKSTRQEHLRTQYERRKAERGNRYAPGVNLYVKNLDDTVTDEVLEEEFSKFGQITSAKVMTDANGRSKGFGFVCFNHREEAAMAVTEMTGKPVGSKPLYVALAQRKEERRQALATQYNQKNIGGMPPIGAPRGVFSGNNPAFQNMGGPAGPQNPYMPNAMAANQAAAMQAAGYSTGFFPPGGFNNPNAQRNFMQATFGNMPNATAGSAQQGAQRGWPTAPGGPPAGVRRMAAPFAATNAQFSGGNNAFLNNNQQMRVVLNQQQLQQQPTNFLRMQQPQQQRAPAGVAMSQQQLGMLPQQQNAAVRMQQGNIAFSAGARNLQPQVAGSGVPPQQQPALPQQVAAQPSVLPGSYEEWNVAKESQRDQLGEHIYPIVEHFLRTTGAQLAPELSSTINAGKLTGMLLEMETKDLFNIIKSHQTHSSEVDSLLVGQLRTAIDLLKQQHLHQPQAANNAEDAAPAV